MLKIKVINLYKLYKIKPTIPKHNIIAIMTKNNAGTNHSGAVTNYQDHVIYPINLRTKSNINSASNKLNWSDIFFSHIIVKYYLFKCIIVLEH